jgi:peptidoglycan/LPS O-acetylase OafA/YrhL
MSQLATWMTRNLEATLARPALRDAAIPVGIPKTRTDVEALRALAILLVVAFHCGLAGVSGGFIGVDVFYVLSGYLITGLLAREAFATSRLSLLQFYARRVRRLLPASSLVLLTTLLVGTLVLAPQELSFAARAARATAFYVSNMFFAKNAADYFAIRVASNPLLHTWSLAVEEQFYLFWPVLIMLGLLVWRSKRVLIGMLIGLTTVSLLACVWLTVHHPIFAFYGLPTRAWEFGIGGLAVLVPRGAWRLPERTWSALGWLGAALILGSCFFVTASMAFPGWLAVIPVAGTAITLVAGAERPHRGVGALFDFAPLQTLGGLSYSWYLWHWPFLVFAAVLFPELGTDGKLAAAACALGVAYVTHRYFENPIRFSPYLVKRPGVSLWLGAATVAVSLAAATVCLHLANHWAAAPEMKALTAAYADVAEMPREQCMSIDSTSEVKSCVFGAPASATNIVLFGDSHAIQWFDALKRLAEARQWKLTTFVKLGCAAVDVSPGRGLDTDPECTAWRRDAIRQIIELRPSLVVMGNAVNKLGRPDDPTVHAGPAYLADLREGTLRTLGPMTTAGLHIAVIRDTPEFPFDVATCLARSLRHSGYSPDACEMPRAAVVDPAIDEAEKADLRGLPHVALIDMTDELCQRGLCKATEHGVVMYRDSHHLTGSFTATLEPALQPKIEAALGR